MPTKKQNLTLFSFTPDKVLLSSCLFILLNNEKNVNQCKHPFRDATTLNVPVSHVTTRNIPCSNAINGNVLQNNFTTGDVPLSNVTATKKVTSSSVVVKNASLKVIISMTSPARFYLVIFHLVKFLQANSTLLSLWILRLIVTTG